MILAGLTLFITTIAISLLFAKKTITLIIISSLISGLFTLFYVLSMAPDVAITEAAVGSAISTIFFILAATYYTNSKIFYNNKSNILFNVGAALICIIIFLILSYLALKMQPYGDPKNSIHYNIADYYIKNTLKDFSIPNIVTAILGGYRGFDTLFETTVIFAAAMGVKAILSDKK